MELKFRLTLALAIIVAATAARSEAQNATFASTDDATRKTAAPLGFGDTPALAFETATFEPPTASCHSATAIYRGLWRLRDGESQSASTTVEAFFNGSRRETTFCAGVLIVWGAALYASELNFFAFDLYRLGFASTVGLAVACVATAFASREIASLGVGAYVATAAGLYANFFDAILDFGFWAFLTVAAILTGVRRVAERRREARRGGKRVETSNERSVATPSAINVESGTAKRRLSLARRDAKRF